MNAIWRSRVAPMVVVREDASPARVRAALAWQHATSTRCSVRIVTETGDEHHGTCSLRSSVAERRDRRRTVASARRRAPVRTSGGLSPARAHRQATTWSRKRSCAVVPRAAAIAPRRFAAAARVWGSTVQLYGVRSRRNWGIGDFTDLGDDRRRRCGRARRRHRRRQSAARAVSPQSAARQSLQPVQPAVPQHALSRRRGDRRFRANAAGAHACWQVRAFQETARRAARRRAGRLPRRRGGQARGSRTALRVVSRPSSRPAHARALRVSATFQREGGDALRRHALFEALQEHCFAQDAAVWGWPAWPVAISRSAIRRDVARFAQRARVERVDYYAYLQWQADLQRAVDCRSAPRSRALRRPVHRSRGFGRSRRRRGLGASVAVRGRRRASARRPTRSTRRARTGACRRSSRRGLRDAGYAPFIATLRANMRSAGALRIDHVMGLMRLFWVPRGRRRRKARTCTIRSTTWWACSRSRASATAAWSSARTSARFRTKCARRLRERDVLSYRVLLFERDAAGEFKPADDYPAAALATASTHDLPTLAGWWDGHDIEVRATLGMRRRRRPPRLHEERARRSAATAARARRAPGCCREARAAIRRPGRA